MKKSAAFICIIFASNFITYLIVNSRQKVSGQVKCREVIIDHISDKKGKTQFISDKKKLIVSKKFENKELEDFAKHDKPLKLSHVTKLIESKQLLYKDISKNNLQNILKDKLELISSNTPPSPLDLELIMEELIQRYPNSIKLKLLNDSMDLQNLFGKDPQKLLDKAEKYFVEIPNDYRTSELYVYALIAQGFDKFSERILPLVNKYPEDYVFKYASIAIDISNNEHQIALEKLYSINKLDPGFSKVKQSIKKIKNGAKTVDEIIDFYPSVDPKDAYKF